MGLTYSVKVLIENFLPVKDSTTNWNTVIFAQTTEFS